MSTAETPRPETSTAIRFWAFGREGGPVHRMPAPLELFDGAPSGEPLLVVRDSQLELRHPDSPDGYFAFDWPTVLAALEKLLGPLEMPEERPADAEQEAMARRWAETYGEPGSEAVARALEATIAHLEAHTKR